MYCHNCKNYYGDGHCRVNGYTSHLKKADSLPCFEREEKTNQTHNDMKETRKCRICGNEKPLEEFAKDSRSGDGLSHICKSCAAERADKRLEKFRASLKKRQAKACDELGITLPGGNEKTPAMKGREENHIAAIAEEIVKEDYLTKEPKTPEPEKEPTLLERPKVVEAIKSRSPLNDALVLTAFYDRLARNLKAAGFTGTLTKKFDDSYEITLTIR